MGVGIGKTSKRVHVIGQTPKALAVNTARRFYTHLAVAGQLGVSRLQFSLGAHRHRRYARQSGRQGFTGKRRLVVNPLKGVQIQSASNQLQPGRFELGAVRFIYLTHTPGQHHLDLPGAGLLDHPADALLIVLRLPPGDIRQSGDFRAILAVRGENLHGVRQRRPGTCNHIALARLPFKKPDHEHPLVRINAGV